MLTRLTIRNLKRFDEAIIELGERVLFVGPNNCGKTTALQALALWQLAVERWLARYPDGKPPPQRPGVVVGRADLVATPVPNTAQLWHQARVGNYRREGKQGRTLDRIHIEVGVEGLSNGRPWSCAIEIDYTNPESINCRPARLPGGDDPPRWSAVPPEAIAQRIAFLPPMSGLTDREFRKDVGEIEFLIGQGRTAEVLRNLCWQVHSRDATRWQHVDERVQRLFGVTVHAPEVGPRAELRVSYDERGTRLDLSCAGRGMQQTLLILCYLELNPGAVLLLDEPDAHLEVLRQGQIYEELCAEARRTGSQIVAATHSEKLLNEAAGRDTVVAFTGAPHRVDARKHQVLKALQSVGFEHYLQAEQRGWVLFLEGSTDLAFLRAFAMLLGHPAEEHLRAPYVQYVANAPMKAVDHFEALADAFPNLRAVGIWDRLDRAFPAVRPELDLRSWARREVENYLPLPEVLVRWAEREAQVQPLLRAHWGRTMAEITDELRAAGEVLGESPWSADQKVSDRFLPRALENFHRRVAAKVTLEKGDYFSLVSLMRPDEVPAEVVDMLDRIAAVAASARTA